LVFPPGGISLLLPPSIEKLIANAVSARELEWLPPIRLEYGKDHLRQTAHRLIHRAWVHDRLERVARMRPALVATVHALWSEDDLTSLLRELARDGVSVRNWQAILDRIAEWHAIRQWGRELPTPWRDHVLTHALAFVRIGLGCEIAYKASRQTSTIVVYLLDPTIERAVTAAARSDDIDDSILEACHKEFAYLPPTAMRPHILTALETRRAVQELLRTPCRREPHFGHAPCGTSVSVTLLPSMVILTSTSRFSY
jgi:flagellar biosynthesis component FlhA